MLGRICSVILIAAVLHCPLMCSLGQGRERAGVGRCSGGCCHSDNGPVRGGERSCPTHSPGKTCCCICGGAVIGDGASQLLDLDTSVWMPVAEPTLSHLPAQEFEINRAGWAPWPDVGMNAGRALCNLYSTLLC